MTQNKPLVGLQLYTLRDELPHNFDDVCRAVAQMGYDAIETGLPEHRTPAELQTFLDELGLICSGLAFGWDKFTSDNGIAQIIDALNATGSSYVMIPWIPHQLRVDEEGWRKVAAKMEEWGQKIKQGGFTLVYHFHGYEYPVVEGSQKTGGDILAEASAPDSFLFQLDTYWAIHGGGDPLAFLQKHGHRIHSIHCKDMNNPKDMHDVEVGSGCVDFTNILPLALKHGIKWYIVEQEQYDKQPREAAAICCTQLKAMLAQAS